MPKGPDFPPRTLKSLADLNPEDFKGNVPKPEEGKFRSLGAAVTPEDEKPEPTTEESVEQSAEPTVSAAPALQRGSRTKFSQEDVRANPRAGLKEAPLDATAEARERVRAKLQTMGRKLGGVATGSIAQKFAQFEENGTARDFEAIERELSSATPGAWKIRNAPEPEDEGLEKAAAAMVKTNTRARKKNKRTQDTTEPTVDSDTEPALDATPVAEPQAGPVLSLDEIHRLNKEDEAAAHERMFGKLNQQIDEQLRGGTDRIMGEFDKNVGIEKGRTLTDEDRTDAKWRNIWHEQAVNELHKKYGSTEDIPQEEIAALDALMHADGEMTDVGRKYLDFIDHTKRGPSVAEEKVPLGALNDAGEAPEKGTPAEARKTLQEILAKFPKVGEPLTHNDVLNPVAQHMHPVAEGVRLAEPLPRAKTPEAAGALNAAPTPLGAPGAEGTKSPEAKAAAMKEQLGKQSGELDKRAEKAGKTFERGLIDVVNGYNKLKWWKKLGITGAFVGGIALTATSMPLVALGFTGLMWGQRALAGVGFAFNARRKLDAKIAKDPTHRLANATEAEKNMYAGVRGAAYFIVTTLLGQGIAYALEHAGDIANALSGSHDAATGGGSAGHLGGNPGAGSGTSEGWYNGIHDHMPQPNHADMGAHLPGAEGAHQAFTVPPVEAHAGDGGIKLFAHLQDSIRHAPGFDANHLSPLQEHILNGDPTKLAQEYGFYHAGQALDSAKVPLGSTLGFDANGDLVYAAHGSATETLAQGHQFGSYMHTAHTEAAHASAGQAEAQPMTQQEFLDEDLGSSPNPGAAPSGAEVAGQATGAPTPLSPHTGVTAPTGAETAPVPIGAEQLVAHTNVNGAFVDPTHAMHYSIVDSLGSKIPYFAGGDHSAEAYQHVYDMALKFAQEHVGTRVVFDATGPLTRDIGAHLSAITMNADGTSVVETILHDTSGNIIPPPSLEQVAQP